MNNTHRQPTPPPNLAQQFCLRWHNHQTSLLTSLPLLLDQSHLTDVTLSAEGRTVRAHRVVLSACSTFFSELFRTLEPPFHPVIVIPGASFGAVVALLTFMYSGEVNVFEEQISTLLSLAETLGIKGLADFSGNASKNSPPTCETPGAKEQESTSPVLSTPTKIASPLENMFAKTFQFCPSILANPLNFSQAAMNRSAEFFNRYAQNQCRSNQLEQKPNDSSKFDENGNSKHFLNIEGKNKKTKTATDMRKIDKIAETLRSASITIAKNLSISEQQYYDKPVSASGSHNSTPSPLMMKLPPPSSPFASFSHRFGSSSSINEDVKPPIDCINSSLIASTPNNQSHPDASISDKILPATTNCAVSTPKAPNSKLYATCFICHKQLSNQYNLRVHLETHQNVRYACSVCSHVSRSKDALRKHVSYRHPGAPSPCDSESKRKRARNMSASQTQPHHLPSTNLPFTPSPQQPIKSEFGSDLTLSPSSIPQNLTMQQQLMNHNSPIQLHGFPTKLSTQPSTLSISSIAATSLSSASVSAASTNTMIASGSMSSATIDPTNRTENNENNSHLRHSFQKETNQSSSSVIETAKRSE